MQPVFRILDLLEVELNGRAVPLGRRERALLAVLLLNAGEVVPVESLIDGVGSTRRRAARSTWSTSTCRGSGTPSATPPHRDARTRLPRRVRRRRIDARNFSTLALSARSPASQAITPRHSTPTNMRWRSGAAIPSQAQVEGDAQIDAARLDQDRLVAAEERVDSALALGRHRELIPELEQRVRDEPLRERPRAQLMLALYRAGARPTRSSAPPRTGAARRTGRNRARPRVRKLQRRSSSSTRHSSSQRELPPSRRQAREPPQKRRRQTPPPGAHRARRCGSGRRGGGDRMARGLPGRLSKRRPRAGQRRRRRRRAQRSPRRSIPAGATRPPSPPVPGSSGSRTSATAPSRGSRPIGRRRRAGPPRHARFGTGGIGDAMYAVANGPIDPYVAVERMDSAFDTAKRVARVATSSAETRVARRDEPWPPARHAVLRPHDLGRSA